MGEVFLAYDERLKRTVAIKQLRSDALTTVEQRARLRREAQAVALLNHPSIVQVYDIVTVNDLDHVVMEYVDGMPLSAFLQEQGPQLTEILQLAQSIAEGLAEAHSKGIVHRDLKSENILVTDTGRAKILDFGLAKQLWPDEDEDSLSVEGSLVGTSVAMSPEQARGGKVDHRSDLFSFGILLYEMLHGCRPFQGSTPLSTIHQIINDPPRAPSQLNPDIPEDLHHLVEQLLEKDPQQRPQHALLVADTLDRLRVWALNAEAGNPLTGTGSQEIPILVPAEEVEKGRVFWPRGLALLGVLVLIGMAIAWSARRSPVEAIRVALPKVEVINANGFDSMLPEIVRTMLQRGLATREGITTFDEHEVDGLESIRDLAEILAVDELLRVDLRPLTADSARLAVRRVTATPNGRLIREAAYDLPLGDTYRFTSAPIERLLDDLYPEFESRGSVSDFAARPADFEQFLGLRLQAQDPRKRSRIAESLAILRLGSPRLLEAHLLEGSLKGYLFKTMHEAHYREQASEILEQVRDFAPADLRPLPILIELSLADEDAEQSARLIAQFEKMQPSDVRSLVFKAGLEEIRGNLDQARSLLHQAIERTPALFFLLRLADFELRFGQPEDARRHLEAFVERVPGHSVALSKLAQLDLQIGELEAAVDRYKKLLKKSKTPSLLSNLGVAQLLMREYDEAAKNFREADRLHPDHPHILLNLGDAELLRGRSEEAESLYQRALKKITEIQAEDSVQDMDWELLSAKSQILAHLGQADQALGLAEVFLEASHGDHRAALSAAVVFALVGEPERAREHLDVAAQGGSAQAWLELPWFDVLDDP